MASGGLFVVQVLGLLRCVYLVPALAPAHAFRASHQYLGVGVGEHLGDLLAHPDRRRDRHRLSRVSRRKRGTRLGARRRSSARALDRVVGVARRAWH